jgi:hypothetical protein
MRHDRDHVRHARESNLTTLQRKADIHMVTLLVLRPR